MRVMEIKPITMAEAKNILIKREKVKELGYEQKLAAEHLKKFTKLKPEEAEKFMTELAAIVRMADDTAVQVANLLPKTNDELRLIFAREKFSLKEDEINHVLELVKKYS